MATDAAPAPYADRFVAVNDVKLHLQAEPAAREALQAFFSGE